MKNDFQPLQHYLKNVYDRIGMQEAVDGVEVIEAYKNIVGDLICKLSSNMHYSNRRLFVSIASAALRQELSYKRHSLTTKINEKIGHNLLDDIVFK